jgi:hypothetical protein
MGGWDRGVSFPSNFVWLSVIYFFFRSILLQNLDSIPEPVDISTGQDLYFEVLELQPIKLSLSFMRTERVSSEEKYGSLILGTKTNVVCQA